MVHHVSATYPKWSFLCKSHCLVTLVHLKVVKVILSFANPGPEWGPGRGGRTWAFVSRSGATRSGRFHFGSSTGRHGNRDRGHAQCRVERNGCHCGHRDVEGWEWGRSSGGCEGNELLCHQILLVQRRCHLRWDEAGERLSWEESIDGGLWLVCASSYGSIDGQLPLGKVVLQVVHNTKAKGVLGVHALHTDHIACCLCHCFPEAHEAVVEESPSVAVGCVGISCVQQREEEEEREHKLKGNYEGGRDDGGRKETSGGRNAGKHAVVHSVCSYHTSLHNVWNAITTQGLQYVTGHMFQTDRITPVTIPQTRQLPCWQSSCLS